MKKFVKFLLLLTLGFGCSEPEEPLQFEAPRILCMGRLVEDKGFDVAIMAFASLIERFPQARLIITGDGPERANLEQQANRLGLKDIVEFTGFIDPKEVPSM
ncbi:glycosyltransferase, partial [Aegicerativicinus sediminis]